MVVGLRFGDSRVFPDHVVSSSAGPIRLERIGFFGRLIANKRHDAHRWHSGDWPGGRQRTPLLRKTIRKTLTVRAERATDAVHWLLSLRGDAVRLMTLVGGSLRANCVWS